MDPRMRWHTAYWFLALAILLVGQSWWQQRQQTESVPYNEFEQTLADGRITEVVVADRTLTGRLSVPTTEGATALVTTRVEPELAAWLNQYGVGYVRIVETTLLRDLLSWILPMLIIVAVWLFVIRRLAERQQGMGGFMNVGKSHAKIYVEANTGVTFADVAGVDEAEQELQETAVTRVTRWESAACALYSSVAEPIRRTPGAQPGGATTDSRIHGHHLLSLTFMRQYPWQKPKLQ